MSAPQIFFELLSDRETGQVQGVRVFEEELRERDAAAIFRRLSEVANALGASPEVLCGDDYLVLCRAEFAQAHQGRSGAEIPRGIRLSVYA